MQSNRYGVGLLCAFVALALFGFGQNNTNPDTPEDKSLSVNDTKKSPLDEEPPVLDISPDAWEHPYKTEPSLIHIMAHPDQYHGKKVFVAGFLRIQKEGNAIYLSENDDQHIMTCNAFWVSLENNTMKMSNQELAKEFSCKYVYLQGTFDKDEHGHMDSYQGGFKNITHISIKEDRAYYKRLREKYRDNTTISQPVDTKK
jgi:hypothetical protein